MSLNRVTGYGGSLSNSGYIKFQLKEKKIQDETWENIHNELKKEFGLVAYKKLAN